MLVYITTPIHARQTISSVDEGESGREHTPVRGEGLAGGLEHHVSTSVCVPLVVEKVAGSLCSSGSGAARNFSGPRSEMGLDSVLNVWGLSSWASVAFRLSVRLRTVCLPKSSKSISGLFQSGDALHVLL